MAKALDPDIETSPTFRLANKKCAEQEEQFQAFEKLDVEDFETDFFDQEDNEVSFPDLFSALKNCIN